MIEVGSTVCRVIRGGYYRNNGTNSPASKRDDGYSPTNNFDFIGLRTTLYM